MFGFAELYMPNAAHACFNVETSEGQSKKQSLQEIDRDLPEYLTRL
jgi:hypothetical protein